MIKANTTVLSKAKITLKGTNPYWIPSMKSCPVTAPVVILAMYPPSTPKNIDRITKNGLIITDAIIFGAIKKAAELTHMISSASTCSVTFMVPISDAIFDPTFPANIKLIIVGEKAKIIESLVATPSAYDGTQGLSNP